ncbi:TetR/AcrR family transcriptional regulator [Dyella sp.]|jgi:TetR/AcrR family transcriptional repressor of nem operon|uniref:TetR/AcrR family transcriptional regulator n=1 Tax=Dyella sp. TaxID=1869338 RepID=UPI002BAFBEAE|nr:TetR/AcrR family transcriptional regulator [Dyella sp.]HTC25822.1 TetR/AcrR family transcriptional regulator [Dyella sp.]
MRYEKGHKETTRRRIIETAAERFRKEGIANVGVANLMSEIGLTQGGFYNHFESKDDLTREALAVGQGRMRERWLKVSSKTGRPNLEELINGYLSTSHRDNVGNGCMLATLAIEAGRAEGPVRAQLTDSIKEMVKLVGSVLPESLKPKQREANARAVVSCLIGTMILARAMDDPEMSDRFLESGRRVALVVAEAAAL